MIAVITSSINPFHQRKTDTRSYVDINSRLQQTIHTIDSLLNYPFKKIFLVDNSSEFDFSILSERFGERLQIRHLHQYQFKNKGINELLLILAIIDELPENEIIFKISGRYYPNNHFNCDFPDGYDFKFRAYNLYSRRGTVSTRAYFVANKEVYKDFLLRSFHEVFIYPQRVVGIRSAIKFFRELIHPKQSTEFSTSIEFAAAKVLKNSSYNLQLVNPIGIEGQIAGFEPVQIIVE